ncbi:MAG: F0F1 ATP synthase subunit A [Ignavibacteriales bacterium]|nr:F0F1 ATP synthase subunit A [Ignavibacteriales bacterium]
MYSFSTSVNDTIQNASPSQSDWIFHHILDSRELSLQPITTIQLPEISLFGLDISITKHVVYLWIVAVFLIITLILSARKYNKTLIPKGFSNLIEIIIVFIRDEIVKPTVGEKYKKYLPYLLTVFFFIISCNIIGLLPYGSTPTGNLAVTATLAIFSFFAIQISGILQHGIVGYFKGLAPKGINPLLLIIIIPIEILSLFTKPFALAIRLFANMTAGHIALMVLLSIIFLFKKFLFAEIAVIPMSIAFSIFIDLLEILVALIQAYIFTMLTSLFIGLAIHQEH